MQGARHPSTLMQYIQAQSSTQCCLGALLHVPEDGVEHLLVLHQQLDVILGTPQAWWSAPQLGEHA